MATRLLRHVLFLATTAMLAACGSGGGDSSGSAGASSPSANQPAAQPAASPSNQPAVQPTASLLDRVRDAPMECEYRARPGRLQGVQGNIVGQLWRSNRHPACQRNVLRRKRVADRRHLLLRHQRIRHSR